MLRLSKKIDYAMMAVLDLATSQSIASRSAREIARKYGIPSELLAKILQRLAHQGIVQSHQGTKGGYRLARAAGAITAGEVIEAIEGPLALAQCFAVEGSCEQFDKCNIKKPLQRLNHQVIAIVSGVTFAEMAEWQRNESGQEADRVAKLRVSV